MRSEYRIFSNSYSLFSELRNQRQAMQNLPLLPLIRYIKENAGINIDIPATTSITNYDLMSSPATRNGAVIFVTLFAYGLIDLLANREDYALAPPWDLFVATGCLMALIAYMGLNKFGPPRQVALGLAFMLGFAGGFASYSGVLRINQLTDDIGLQDHDYVIADNKTLKPVDPGLPVISVDPDAFWESQPSGTPIILSLRKGGMDFYQIDKEVIYSYMRRWYCEQRVKEHPDQERDCKEV